MPEQNRRNTEQRGDGGADSLSPGDVHLLMVGDPHTAQTALLDRTEDLTGGESA